MLKKPGLLLLSLAAMLFVVIASTAPAHAATLSEDSEKFLRYRAVAGCLAKNDLENTSPTKVINGEWFKAGVLSTNNTKLSAALLTGGDSNDTHCKDDAADDFLVSSASTLGFSDTGAMWCSIQPNAGRDKDATSGNDFERCTQGSGDYDVSDDDGPEQAAQFTEGIKAYATGGAAFPLEPSGAMRYYIYYQTFMEFCESTREKDYIESTDKTKADSKQYVVINEVILNGEGKYEIVPALYKVSQDDGQGHNVEGVWSLPNGNPYSQTCGELAQKTWEFDDAYGLYLQAHPDEAVQPGGGSSNGIDDPVCSAGALGWIICPLSEGMVEIIQQVAEMLQGLLIYQPLIGSDQGNAIKAIWNLILVIANLGLVFAILIIVFSQATSVGLSNYGIKKLLPRVFAAAILMNLSFYLCAVAVDLSNILGVSVKAIVEAGMNQLAAINNAGNSGVEYGAGIGQHFTVGVVGLLAAAIAFGTGAIWLLLPILVSGVVAIITALLILAARQILITLLIIISPLAILAWILPNTDEWFTKWRKLFTILLLLFPMIMAIFYGSILVSSVILSAGANTGNGLNDFTIKLLAFLVLIVPLFSLPFILKAAGGILDRFGVIVNNRNKGIIDRSRKASQEKYDARKNTRRMNAFGEGGTLNPWKANMRRQATRDHKRGLRKGIAEENSQDYIARKALKGGEGRFSYSGRMVNSSDPSYIAAVQASAQATVDKQDRQSVTNREILYKARLEPGDNDSITDELKKAAELNDTIAVRALQNMYTYNGSSGIDAMREGMSILENDPKVTASTIADARKNLNENHGKTLKDKSYDMLLWSSQAGVKPGDPVKELSDYSSAQGTWNGLSVAEIAGQSGGSVQIAARTGAVSPEKTKALLDDARVRERLSDKQVAALEGARESQKSQTQAYSSYADNVTSTQRREQNEAYETYRDNINPPGTPPSGSPPTPPPAGGGGTP